MAFEIEANIPFPEHHKQKYPFHKMDVGDSFLFTGNAPCVRSSASDYGKRNGKRFSSRKVEGGLRIWRIE